MAKLLFRLRHVPDDEADAIRSLLADRGFETYETTAGMMHWSMPAIWLVHEGDFPAARALIDRWQQEHRVSALEAAQENPPLGLWQRFQQAPFKMGLLWLAIVLVAGLTTWPFWRFFVTV